MGSWNVRSSCSDTVWDYLEAKNIHRMTSKEIKQTFDHIFKEYPLPWDLTKKTFWQFEMFLGIVIHCLDYGWKVPKEQLDRALKIINIFLGPDVTWTSHSLGSPKEKIASLKNEKKIIQQALNKIKTL